MMTGKERKRTARHSARPKPATVKTEAAGGMYRMSMCRIMDSAIAARSQGLDQGGSCTTHCMSRVSCTGQDTCVWKLFVKLRLPGQSGKRLWGCSTLCDWLVRHFILAGQARNSITVAVDGTVPHLLVTFPTAATPQPLFEVSEASLMQSSWQKQRFQKGDLPAIS
jgi:hypothetical protein